MEVIDQFSEEHIKQLHQLYQTVWWAKGRSLEDTQRCVSGSQICIGILNPEQQLIGFVRVLTDYIFKALIFDVIVSEPYRGMGLGDRLMLLVREHAQLQAVKHFELYCLPDMEAFYNRHDFSAEVGELLFMRRIQT